MTEITIEVSDEVKNLIEEIDEPLYMEAIKDVAKFKLAEEQNSLYREMGRKVKRNWESSYWIAENISECALWKFIVSAPYNLKQNKLNCL